MKEKKKWQNGRPSKQKTRDIEEKELIKHNRRSKPKFKEYEKKN